METPIPTRWEAYADVVLQRAALAQRIRRGEPPRPMAGLVVDDDEIAVLLNDLPGLEPDDQSALDALAAATDDAIAAAEADLLDADGSDPFAAIAWNAKLDVVSRRVLAVAAAIEFDLSRQRLAGYLNDDVSRRWLTPAIVARLFGRKALACVDVDSPLARACLVSVVHETTWALSAVRVAPVIVSAMSGAGVRDARLPRDAAVEEAHTDAGSDFVLIHGGDRRTRIERASLATSGARFLVTSLPADDHAWEAVTRQCVLGGLGLVVELGSKRALTDDERWWIDRLLFIPVALCSESELALGTVPERPFQEVRVEAGLAESSDGHLLDREQARLVDKALVAVGGDRNAAVRRLMTGQLDAHARRTRAGRKWDELVLPDDQVAVLRELVARYRHRQRVFHEWGFPARPSVGVTALFAGPSGTGKTMTAEIISTELGLDLYRIDLSSVVSKYIGETEKNLEEIFTASSAGNMVLFFDEADALFGKRSEVSDAHDRYANIEVAYLLQRLEHYDGFVILATNLRKNIDPAFLRRVDVALEFEQPDKEHRRAIWERVFPLQSPIGALDHGWLAEQFEVSGGSIRNAAVHAAFLAAEVGSSIEMHHVTLGMRREYQKMGRLHSHAEYKVDSRKRRTVGAAAS